ncbi:hypothetical protein AN958_04421 [Leucoagaricus sp. SymC.cos]|nr:hypothetical protein AN958_04421 [Leucoagaricus sp. SymC.cos]
MSTLTTSDDTTVYRIDKIGTIYPQLSLDDEEKVIAIAAGDSDTLYKLTSGGIVSRFRNGKWDIIDINPKTRGIAASGSNAYLINSTGDMFKYNGRSWDWFSGILLGAIAIIADGGSLYSLGKTGTIWKWGGAQQWTGIDFNYDDKMVVAGGGKLYQLRAGGAILIFNRQSHYWDNLDSDPNVIQIAAGNAGFYKLQNDYMIWKYSGEQGWERISSFIADGGSLYSLGKTGTIWKWGGAQQWTGIDFNYDDKMVVAGGGKLYQLRAGGAILIFNRQSHYWDNLDSDPNAIQIAAGNAGFYKLQNDYTIWKYSGEQGWERISSGDSKVAEISVGDYLYVRKEDGEVIKYTENGWESVTKVVYEHHRPKSY